MWLVMTPQGDFFITVSGSWTREVAARHVRLVFDSLQLDIIGMIPRRRATGPDEIQCTIYETEEQVPPFGFTFLAGRKLWLVCGRVAEYDAEMVLHKKQLKEFTRRE
jgi:hypothetical protein